MNKPHYSFRKTHYFLKRISSLLFLFLFLPLYSVNSQASSARYALRFVSAPLIITEKLSGKDENFQTLNHGLEGQYLFFQNPKSAFHAGLSLLVDPGYAAANQVSFNTGLRRYFIGSGTSERLANTQVTIDSKGQLAAYWGLDFRYIKYTIPRKQFPDLYNVLEKDVSTNSFSGGVNLGTEYGLNQTRALNAELGLNIAQFGQETTDEISIITPFYLSIGISENF